MSPELNRKFPFDASQRIASASEGLSFAYLQEIFVSSMVDIFTTTGDLSVESINSEQILDAINKRMKRHEFPTIED